MHTNSGALDITTSKLLKPQSLQTVDVIHTYMLCYKTISLLNTPPTFPTTTLSYALNQIGAGCLYTRAAWSLYCDSLYRKSVFYRWVHHSPRSPLQNCTRNRLCIPLISMSKRSWDVKNNSIHFFYTFLKLRERYLTALRWIILGYGLYIKLSRNVE